MALLRCTVTSAPMGLLSSAFSGSRTTSANTLRDGAVRKLADSLGASQRQPMSKRHNPFRCFNSSPEVTGLVVMMYVCFLLSLRKSKTCSSNAASAFSGDGAAVMERFGPLFASEIRKRRASRMRGFRQWQWPWTRRHKD